MGRYFISEVRGFKAIYLEYQFIFCNFFYKKELIAEEKVLENHPENYLFSYIIEAKIHLILSTDVKKYLFSLIYNTIYFNTFTYIFYVCLTSLDNVEENRMRRFNCN